MSRIFPTQQAELDAFGTQHEFVGIDYNKVANSLRNPESSKPSVLAKELREQLIKIARNEEDYDEESVRVANTTKSTRTASNHQSPIRFTHPDQISGKALLAAEQTGNVRLANAIKGAREQLLNKLASTIEKNEKLAEASLKKRTAVRAETAKVAETRKTQREATSTSQTKTSSFKPLTKLSEAEKSAFVKIASKSGFSTDYIEAVMTPSTNNDAKVEEIKSVMASNINDSTKRTVVSSLTKSAGLDDEQLNRLKDYWKNELQYGDKKYIDDWFTKMSNDTTEEKNATYEGADSSKGE